MFHKSLVLDTKLSSSFNIVLGMIIVDEEQPHLLPRPCSLYICEAIIQCPVTTLITVLSTLLSTLSTQPRPDYSRLSVLFSKVAYVRLTGSMISLSIRSL